MTTLLMILGGCLVGLIVGLMDPTPKDNPRKPKKKEWRPRHSPQKRAYKKDDDDFWDYAWS